MYMVFQLHVLNETLPVHCVLPEALYLLYLCCHGTWLAGGDGKSKSPGAAPPSDTIQLVGDRGSAPSIFGEKQSSEGT